MQKLPVLSDYSQALDGELIIVEGKSAASAVQRVRDRQTQAVISMQGKIPNALSPGAAKKLLGNVQIQQLLVALDPSGTGELPLDKIRYKTLLLLSDPDADGLHARALLILFFFTHLRSIVERGLLFIATPPLYRIQSSVLNKIAIAYTKSEYENTIKSLADQDEHHPEVTRYKGLASLDQQTLYHYCLNPQGRRVRQLSVTDCEALLSNMRKIKS